MKDSYGLFHDHPFLDGGENLAVDTIISLASLAEAKIEGGDQQGGFSIVASMVISCFRLFPTLRWPFYRKFLILGAEKCRYKDSFESILLVTDFHSKLCCCLAYNEDGN